MKKIVLFAAVAAATGFAACTSQAPKANLKSETDSLSYMLGIANTDGLTTIVERQFGLDSLQTADFIQGFLEGINSNNKSYNVGREIGQRIGGQNFEYMSKQILGNDSTKSLDKNNFIAGFVGALQNKASMTPQEATKYVNNYILDKQFGENKAAGEKFLAENATKEGVQTTPSGLQYKVIKQGKGAVPTNKNTVKVHYKGTLIDGTEFDSSYSRNEPSSFPVTGVIKGWTEALTMMPVGSKWELYIPQELAYGTRNQSKIKPFSTLVFEVELLEIVK